MKTCRRCGEEKRVGDFHLEAGEWMCRACVIRKYEEDGVNQKVIDYLKQLEKGAV